MRQHICSRDWPGLIVIRLIGDEQRTKAAAWAYFAGDEEQAVRILMSSDSAYILLHHFCHY